MASNEITRMIWHSKRKTLVALIPGDATALELETTTRRIFRNIKRPLIASFPE